MIAEEIVQSMISLMGEGNAGADGAAPVGKGVGGSAGSVNKRDRAPAAEKEIEMEEEDLDGDMDFINDIQDEIANKILFVFPPTNWTAPLTFSLWEREVPFYEAFQKLYSQWGSKDGRYKLALSWGSQGMGEVMPLHLMIGTKYLDKILEVSPTGMWLLLIKTGMATFFFGCSSSSSSSLLSTLKIVTRQKVGRST